MVYAEEGKVLSSGAHSERKGESKRERARVALNIFYAFFYTCLRAFSGFPFVMCAARQKCRHRRRRRVCVCFSSFLLFHLWQKHQRAKIMSLERRINYCYATHLPRRGLHNKQRQRERAAY